MFLLPWFALAVFALAADPLVPTPAAGSEARVVPLKDLDGYFPFTPAPTPEAWQQRAEQVRMQLRVALGLWPEPTRTPLNALVHGRIEQPDYTVERVAFESMPGFFVTGSLFRPRTPGPHPAVLCPHGHWPDGRFQQRSDAEMKKELASGGERFPDSGRSIFQSLGVQLARMGCVAFVIDMLGYADSQQISYEVAHKFAKQRPEMNDRESWGLFSPQAEAHAQSVLGLQTWNCIRALDFLTSLPDVDARRLGCTGASGGGTQTLLLGALDPRLTVSAPAVMVSTAMQGGCTCENASGLRIGTGNVEFAALFAPKPLGMTSANDWTRELPTKGFPELQRHWAMLGAPENVALWAMPEFPHNHNLLSREKIYAWLNQHFALGLAGEQLREREYPLLTREQLTVWDAAHPAPPSGPEFERKLLRWWHDDAQQQMTKDFPTFRRIARPALATLLPHRVTVVSPLAKPASYVVLVRDEAVGDSFAAALTKAGLIVSEERLSLPAQAPKVKNPRESAAYTLGYNAPLFVESVQQVLSAVGRFAGDGERRFALAAFGPESSAVVAAAAALSDPQTVALVLDTGSFRFHQVPDIRSPMLVPGAAKYGDLPGLLALGAPRKLFLMGEGAIPPDLITAAYETAGVSDTLRVSEKQDLEAAAQWLIEAMK